MDDARPTAPTTHPAHPAHPARTAAELLVQCLEAEGCDYVFSVPGEETMDVLEALADRPAVRHITTRHEQGAAFMADVYGRLTGRCAVAMATLGPGATNLVTGVADAYLDRAPMVATDRPGRLGQAPQGGAPGRRHRADVRAGHQVEPRVSSASTPSPRSCARRSASRTLEKPGPTHIELPENSRAMPSRVRRRGPAR